MSKQLVFFVIPAYDEETAGRIVMDVLAEHREEYHRFQFDDTLGITPLKAQYERIKEKQREVQEDMLTLARTQIHTLEQEGKIVERMRLGHWYKKAGEILLQEFCQLMPMYHYDMDGGSWYLPDNPNDVHEWGPYWAVPVLIEW